MISVNGDEIEISGTGLELMSELAYLCCELEKNNILSQPQIRFCIEAGLMYGEKKEGDYSAN